MGEYVKDQTTATSNQPGDWFVFDTATGTFKISYSNLFGSMNQNTLDVATNLADIATNADDIADNADDISNLQHHGLEVKQIELSEPDIKSLFTSPITLVTNTGGFIQVVDIAVAFTAGVAAYASNSYLKFKTGSELVGEIDSSVYTSSGDMYAQMIKNNHAISLTADDLKISTASNPTTGNGSMVVSIIFKRIS